MFKVVKVLFAAATLFSASALADPVNHIATDGKQLSNGARLARGLPPRAPKFGRYVPGQESKTVQARQAGPSTVAVTGRIAVTRADNGAQLGFISSLLNGAQVNGITADANVAQTVSLATGVNPLDLLKTGVFDGSNFGYLGAAVSTTNTNDNLSVGSTNSVVLTGVNQTPSGSTPQPIGNAYANVDSESNIFNYNNGVLTATYINADGTAAPSIIVYDPTTDTISIVGDAAAFIAANPNAVIVNLSVQ